MSASVGDMTVTVSSVIGKGPSVGKPAAVAELLPAAVLAPPTPPLTIPADSKGTAITPNVACPDAAMPEVTALLAWVLAVLAFCALSAALTVRLPSALQTIVISTPRLTEFLNLMKVFL